MFRATHIDGPLAGSENDVSIAAPLVPDVLYYAPAPDPVTPVTASGHMLVGYGQAPELPWPGQVAYALDRARSDLRAHEQYEGMEQGTAAYRLAEGL